ncbi:MAG TPA: carboxypeptidase regulatory-like domain-containing protein, partial [Kofleriaceae bacterium]|nr:carboxypeptidase regulatory-like domain-containing protein [Kofleriaceae bacterium]
MRAFVAIAVVASVAVADAAPRVVRGVVTVHGSTKPIPGATVLTERGELAVSDLDGYFSIEVTPADRELTITAPGYATRTIRVVAGDALLRIELSAAKGSEVIEITGKAPEQTKPLSYQLTADEIRFLPGAANDVLRAAQVLPGVSRIPYSFGGLVLRGTSPRDSAVFLDGIEVPIAFHFGGITSFYPGTMLDSLTVLNGGFDASHGHAQGGLVTLTTREPRTDRWRVGGTIGLLDSSVWAEGPLYTGGIIMGIRRSYLDTILDPFVEEDVPLPSYWDAQIKSSFGDPRKRGRITPMIFTSIDRVASEDITATSLFVRAAAPYLRSKGPLTLRVVPWVGWTQLSLTEEPRSESDQRARFRRPMFPAGVRGEVLRDYTWGHLRGGVDVDSGYLSQFDVDVMGSSGKKFGAELYWTDLALWGETRIKLDGERFSVKPGLRVDAYGLSEELVVDPRLNIFQQLTDKISLRQAIGRFHQPPIPADVDPFNGNPKLDGSYVDQASFGLDAEIYPGVITSVTSFAGFGNQIGVEVPHGNDTSIEPNTGGLGPTFQLLLEKQLGFSSYRENLGRARLFGVESLLKGNIDRWFFLLAYTLSWSQRTDNPATGQGWRPFELDQRHNLNIAASYRLAKWRFGARLQFVTGNPYSPTPAGEEIPMPMPFAGRLPAFFHLDVRVDRSWHRCWGDVNLFFDIQNVTNRTNVEGREYGYTDEHPLGADEDIPGLPIVPF